MSLNHFRAAWLAWTLPAWTALSACAAQPRQPVARPGMSAAEEAAAIDAARHHPIARPEPRTLYPEQAPPPLAEHGAPTMAPPGAPAQFASAPSQADQSQIVAPTAPPNDYVDAPAYAAPGPDYVWTPGYWAWSGTGYVWVTGDWLRSRPGYVYLGPRWSRTGYGWEFSVGGWARGGTSLVTYPVYRYPYAPYQQYYAPGYYSARRLGSSGYSGSRAYVAPPARYHDSPRSAPYEEARQRSYHDSSIAPRGSSMQPERQSPVRAAPPAAPQPAASAPPVTRGIRVEGGGGRATQRTTVRTRR
jgi:hypothetical protein